MIRGLRRRIRSDNGPEFIARAVRDFLAAGDVGTLYIEPRAPWENGYAESFHSRLTDELIESEIFIDLLDAQEMVARPKNFYNNRRALVSRLPDPRGVRGDAGCPSVRGCAPPSGTASVGNLSCKPDSHRKWCIKRVHVRVSSRPARCQAFLSDL